MRTWQGLRFRQALCCCLPTGPRWLAGLPQVLERRGLASSSDEEAPLPAANGRDGGAPHKSKSTSALAAGGGGGGQRGGLAAAAKAALRGVEPELYHPEELLGDGASGLYPPALLPALCSPLAPNLLPGWWAAQQAAAAADQFH